MRTVHSRLRPGRAALVALALFPLAGAVIAQDVWVVFDARNPVRNTSQACRMTALDAGLDLEAKLSAHLPHDQQDATRILWQRIGDGGLALQKRMQDAYQGVADAWSLGITSIPAVVVDQRYVVYGEPDVARAVARIEQYRRMQR